MSAEALKCKAAQAGLAHVRDGMTLGLGTGSTVRPFVEAVGKLVSGGLKITCVPTSEATATQARGLDIPLSTLDEVARLDVTVDGADELDAQLRLIKGGGGALLHEKIVAGASDEMVVIADSSKKVATLGRFPLPIEVVRFGACVTAARIGDIVKDMGLAADIRQRQAGDAPFITDSGNFIYDCHLARIHDPEALALALQAQVGIVEHGLFIGFAARAYIAGEAGVEELTV